MALPKKKIEENKQITLDLHYIRDIFSLQQYYEGLVKDVMLFLNGKRNKTLKIGETTCLVNLDEDRN